MKRKLRTACLLLLLLFLTACGSAETVGKGAGGDAARTGAESVHKSAPAPAAFDASDVENNGGYYVRVGGKVYFRKYGPDALGKLAIFGEFAKGWNASGDESEIVSYDLTTRAVETVFKDTGYGEIYVGDGGFYLQERMNGADYVAWYSADGAECKRICDGSLLGLTDGGLLAAEEVSGDGDSFSLYRNEQLTGYFISQSSMSFAGLSDDGLFLFSTEYDSEADEYGTLQCTLWQLAPDSEGTLLRLGSLPETDYMFSPERGQFVAAENQIGGVMGYYAGTGHFLNDFAAFTATPGAEDSLSVMDVAPAEEEGEPSLPKLAVGDAGNIAAFPYLYGDLRIGYGEDNDGDLELYDGFQWTTLQKGFADYRTDGSGYAKLVQNMEYVDGAAYATLAAAYASTLDDIGWRSAYALLDMSYVVVPASQGAARELACVEYDTVLQGNVWFQDGFGSLLWQQNASDADVWKTEADCAFLIPISPDAEWEYKDDILAEAAFAEPEGEPEYSGYPLPETEGQFLRLRLNRDGEAVFLTRKAPNALLTIDVGVTEAELSDAVAKIEPTRRPSDEDIPWQWARLTALQDGVTVLIERTPDEETVTEELAAIDGIFIHGSTLFQRVLNRGESVGLYMSLPWHPEIRVCVMRNGTFGHYVFGEDNYMHEEPVNGRYAQKILAGYPVERDNGVVGSWLYRDALTKEHTVWLDFVEQFDFAEDKTLTLTKGDETLWLKWDMARLHAEDWEAPDLLCLETDDPQTVAALNGMSGSAGDYYVERFDTDGEKILHLSQVNNGDAALDTLIPHQAQWMTDFTLHFYSGAAQPAVPLRNIALTAEIVKTDAARNVVWLQEAEARYERDDMVPTYRAKPDAACVACPLASQGLLNAFSQCPDPEYPMTAFQVTIDRDGFVTSFDSLSAPDEP